MGKSAEFEKEIGFKDSQLAFRAAINSGRLSLDKTSANYAGNYMYMGTCNKKDLYKNIITREYLD